MVNIESKASSQLNFDCLRDRFGLSFQIKMKEVKLLKSSILFAIVLVIVLQYVCVRASKANKITACKLSVYYEDRNVEFICSDERPLIDIFANISTTKKINCLDDQSWSTNTVNSVSFTNCTFRRAPIHIFSYFPLETIDVRETSLQRLRKHDFVDAPQLTRFLASENNISSIPANLFRFAPRIDSVYLSSNSITEINPQAFNATKITFLQLSLNRLTRVSKLLIESLTNLESLYLDGNNISEIEPGAFSQPKRLDALQLGDNKLEELTSNMFSGLWRAYRLELSSNNIKRIETNSFDGLRGLLTLDLSSNYIDNESIQPHAFNGLSKVYKLHLNDNKITKLSNGMFEDLPGLQYLELRNNQISSIDSLAFNNPELHDLDLSFNKIARINADIFLHAPKMSKVNLSHTAFAEIEHGFLSSANKLEELDLSYCRFEAIDFNRFSTFAETLRSLYVDGNALTELSDDVRDILPKLENLGITNNNFSCSVFEEDIYPTLGTKILSRAIEKYPNQDQNGTYVHGIRCTN